MALTLTQSTWHELRDTAAAESPLIARDDFEAISPLPSCLGTGFSRDFDLAPGMWMNLTDWQCQQDWSVKVPVHDHPIQIGVFLSGVIETGGVHPTLGKNGSYFSGSGLSPGYKEQHFAGQRLMCVNVELEPEVLESTFGELEPSLRSLLYKGQDWKTSFYPRVTPAMRSLAQQIWNAPYSGTMRRMYLHGKAWELLALQLDLVSIDQASSGGVVTLKRDTISRLHHAREILQRQVEQPPTLLELATQVGVSERTLRRGFQELFSTTVFGYVSDLRMTQAEQLLREQNHSVTEVATIVGYSNPSHFTTAFKRKFGVTPRECAIDKRSVSR
jgi:AraC-like DNA-binding protein